MALSAQDLKDTPEDPLLASFKRLADAKKLNLDTLPDLQFVPPAAFETEPVKDESIFFSLRKFSMLRNSDVFIAVLQQNLQSSSVSGLRQILSLEDRAIFDLDSGDEGILRQFELGAVLGNLNDNQFNNKRSGSEAPRFYLEQMRVLKVSAMPALLILGNFIDACAEPSSRYKGLHFLRESELGKARCYELFYQSPVELFERHLADFEASTSTIRLL